MTPHRNRLILSVVAVGLAMLVLVPAAAAPGKVVKVPAPLEPPKKEPANPAPVPPPAPDDETNELQRLIQRQLQQVLPPLPPDQQAEIQKQIQEAIRGLPGVPLPGNVQVAATTTTIQGNSITTRHQSGALAITVTGTLENGKCKPSEITIEDNGAISKYDSLDKVPAQFQPKVKSLIERSGPKLLDLECDGLFP